MPKLIFSGQPPTGVDSSQPLSIVCSSQPQSLFNLASGRKRKHVNDQFDLTGHPKPEEMHWLNFCVQVWNGDIPSKNQPPLKDYKGKEHKSKKSQYKAINDFVEIEHEGNTIIAGTTI